MPILLPGRNSSRRKYGCHRMRAISICMRNTSPVTHTTRTASSIPPVIGQKSSATKSSTSINYRKSGSNALETKTGGSVQPAIRAEFRGSDHKLVQRLLFRLEIRDKEFIHALPR